LSKNKTFSSEISQRYALALYELSKENDLTQEFESNILNFLKIYKSNQDLVNFIKNPTNTIESQKIVFEKILNNLKLNKLMKNFFLILIIKKRIFFIDKIFDEFLKLISTKRGEISANLISSKKIDKENLLNIEKEISTSLNRSIKMNYKLDENLIGGIIIQIGSLMIDTSLKNKLQKYKKLMLEA
jgi:ATP synthase, F1 delta subunit|tara:strand:- start:391 stop:948 length:558 start_codon:yes stop_codon:yes gene_type:complete